MPNWIIIGQCWKLAAAKLMAKTLLEIGCGQVNFWPIWPLANSQNSQNGQDNNDNLFF
jgi:hypothetical protein